MPPLPLPAADDDDPALLRLVRRLRFRHLRMLLMLKECGSLHAAARRLNVTQPALSKTLAEVESAFGVALFERDARGVAPTRFGVTVLRGARLLLDELDRLRRETLSTRPVLELTLGTTPFVAQGYLPDIFRRLVDADATLRLSLVEAAVPELVAGLEEGDLDAAITTVDLSASLTTGFLITKLFTVDLEVIAAADDALTRRGNVPWSDLVDRRWILPPAESLATRSVCEMFRLEGLPQPDTVLVSRQPSTNLQMVGQAVGLSVVPSPVLSNQGATPRVGVVQVAPRLPRRPVALLHRRTEQGRWLPLLLEAIAASSRERGWSDPASIGA